VIAELVRFLEWLRQLLIGVIDSIDEWLRPF